MRKKNKIERFQWALPGDSGTQCTLNLSELNIDHSYQRPESLNHMRAIARDFDWIAFGSIVVMERGDGMKFIVDGQQRALAAKLRGDISSVPCIVFKSSGRNHEARAFVALNMQRKQVSAISKFCASVISGSDPEKQIAEWLTSVGLSVTNGGRDVCGVSFPADLVRTWGWDFDMAKNAINMQRRIIGISERLHCECHRGIFWLLYNGVDVSEHEEKLSRLGGLVAMQRSIKAMSLEQGKASTYRVCGLGILSLINNKRRNKVVVKETAFHG